MKEGKAERITPACAGKRRFVAPSKAYVEDHPRVCGEKLSEVSVDEVNVGSPPRVRGKAEALHRRKTESGITPACAGKRAFCKNEPKAGKDHPRVCGEKFNVFGKKG